MEEKAIDLEDLSFLEKDLTRDELTSVLFLLYTSEKPQWILEEIAKPESKNFLNDYATHHSNWKSSIVESLTIVKLFEVVELLGVSAGEARGQLTQNPSINPGVRLLYELCESCEQRSTDELIMFIKDRYEPAEQCCEQMLEFYLLHAISSKRIKISPLLDDCDFSFITEFFNKHNFAEVQEVLKKFPKKSNSVDSGSNSGAFNTRLLIPLSDKATCSMLGEYTSKKMYVLIINQQTFESDKNPEWQQMLPDHALNERKGTKKDSDALKLLFESFGYEVTAKSNLKHNEILLWVDKATKHASKVDGLIVCVLSHGHEGLVYGQNSIPVNVSGPNSIKSIMASPLLLGKPKILIIQACQGERLQKSVKKNIVSKLELDGPAQSTTISGSVFADFLIFWSTIEGFASVRHVDNGSWFIQGMVNKIRELHVNQHLMDICTAAINEVSLKRGSQNECMLPKLETTFTKNFRFPTARNDSNC